MMEFERAPDALDNASNLEAAERDACVAAQLAKPTMKANGFCHDPGCFAPLPKGQMFCGEECRDYYEKIQRMKDIVGKR